MLWKTLRLILKLCVLPVLIIFFLIIRSESKLVSLESIELHSIVYFNSNQKALEHSQEDLLLKSEPEILVIVEWQGNNIRLDQWEAAGYHINLNQPDPFTFGCLVLSKHDIRFEIIHPNLSENCPYPLFLGSLKYNGQHFLISPIHFPPPLPHCNFSTTQYLDFLNIKLGALKTPYDHMLLVGDFNMMNIPDGIQTLKSLGFKNLTSSIDFTWRPLPLFPSLLRLDYAWSTNPNSKVGRIKLKGIDHYGLILEHPGM